MSHFLSNPGNTLFFCLIQFLTTHSKNTSKKGEISPIYVDVTLIGKITLFFLIQTQDSPLSSRTNPALRPVIYLN